MKKTNYQLSEMEIFFLLLTLKGLVSLERPDDQRNKIKFLSLLLTLKYLVYLEKPDNQRSKMDFLSLLLDLKDWISSENCKNNFQYTWEYNFLLTIIIRHTDNIVLLTQRIN
jgi:hypothetical protein